LKKYVYGDSESTIEFGDNSNQTQNVGNFDPQDDQDVDEELPF